MEDIIQKYHKKKRKNTLAIIFTSLALAIGFNFYINSTEVGQMVKWNLFETSSSHKEISDLSLGIQNNLVSLKSSKNMTWVKSISVTFVYNDENLSIKDTLVGIDGAEIVDISNNAWYNTYLITFPHFTNISHWDDILKLVLEKQDINLKEYINLSQANFIDQDERLYALSTSGIEY